MSKHKQTHHKPHKAGKGFNLDAFQNVLRQLAYSSSYAACARLVCLAIEAGLGTKLSKYPLVAAGYASHLPRIGFHEIEGKKARPVGIVVFASIGKGAASYGHIAGLTTSGWYSNFKQNDRSGLSSIRPLSRVFRR